MVSKTPTATAESVRDIHTFIDDISRIDENEEKDNAVYVLECLQYIEDNDRMREHLKNRHTPDENDRGNTWRYPTVYDTAMFADIVYYVGESGNLSQRIKHHISMQGSTLTEAFPPCSIERIEWVDSRQTALERESQLLDELGNMDELPDHMGYNTHTTRNHFDIAYQNVEEIFPSKVESLSERGVNRFSHAIAYARDQDGVLASDTEEIRKIATEREKELKEREPEKIVFAQGG